MSVKLDWTRDGADWPLREHSRFVSADGLRWHVQDFGEGPTVLLLHGAGAATHSWRDLAPLLAQHFRVVAPDLPGHGFTDTPDRTPLSLPEMARRLTGLIRALDIEPALVVGHSAGAAIGIRMALDGQIAPRALVSINGALLPFQGVTGPLFQGMAKALFANPFTAGFFAMSARDNDRVARLITGTGSRLDPPGLDLYARLFRSSGHVGATLGMMAAWDLEPLRREIGGLTVPLTLIVGDRDAAVPPSVATRVRASLPTAEIVTLPGLGHLAHEEDPAAVADIILHVAERHSPREEQAA